MKPKIQNYVMELNSKGTNFIDAAPMPAISTIYAQILTCTLNLLTATELPKRMQWHSETLHRMKPFLHPTEY